MTEVMRVSVAILAAFPLLAPGWPRPSLSPASPASLHATQAAADAPKPVEELASRLLAASTEAEQEARLAAHPDLVTPELRVALITETNRRLVAGEYAQALDGYRLTARVAERLGDATGLASALAGIGTVHGRRGEYPEAARFLRESLALSEQLGDQGRVITALNNLGIVYRLQGEYDEALAAYERTLAIAKSSPPDFPSIPRATNNIGIVHEAQGNYRLALEFYRRSLELKEKAGQIGDIPETLTNLGSIHERQGDLDLALDYYTRSVKLVEQLERPAMAAVSLAGVGRIHASRGDYAAALDHHSRALALEQSAGRRSEASATLKDIGNVHWLRGEPEEALRRYQESLSIREAINERPGIAETLIALARVFRARGDAGAALEAALRATRLAGETGHRELLWKARTDAGESHEALDDPAAARAAFGEAIDLIEDLRSDVAGSEWERQRFFESRLRPYHRLAALLLEQGRDWEALAVAERARARVLLDVMRAGRADRRLLTQEERERERDVQRTLTTAHARLWVEAARSQPDEHALETLRAEVRQARVAHVEFRGGLYRAHPALPLQRGEAVPLRPEDAASVVDDPRLALLMFMVTEDATHLFVLSRPGEPAAAGPQLKTFTIGISRRALVAETERFRTQLARRDLDFRPTARALFERLLGPAREELRGKTGLVILPDDVLWELPFQALESGRGRYVIEDASLSYAPSLAVLREARARPRGDRPGAPSLLAFGDPQRRDATGEPTRSAPAPVFDPLPDAARQVRELTRLYGRGSSRVFLGIDATESRLKERTWHASVLHVATHGFLDDTSPMYSFVLLAESADDDGRLEVWEIADLNLSADVAVLAACETARGRIGAGEGVIGLSWALFLAGVPVTVASQWRVDAASTTELMLAFHRQLRRGLSRSPARPGVAESLRAAALQLLKNPQYRHPFYWAGFVAVGDGGE